MFSFNAEAQKNQCMVLIYSTTWPSRIRFGGVWVKASKFSETGRSCIKKFEYRLIGCTSFLYLQQLHSKCFAIVMVLRMVTPLWCRYKKETRKVHLFRNSTMIFLRCSKLRCILTLMSSYRLKKNDTRIDIGTRQQENGNNCAVRHSFSDFLTWQYNAKTACNLKDCPLMRTNPAWHYLSRVSYVACTILVT